MASEHKASEAQVMSIHQDCTSNGAVTRPQAS